MLKVRKKKAQVLATLSARDIWECAATLVLFFINSRIAIVAYVEVGKAKLRRSARNGPSCGGETLALSMSDVIRDARQGQTHIQHKNFALDNRITVLQNRGYKAIITRTGTLSIKVVTIFMLTKSVSVKSAFGSEYLTKP